MKLFVAYLGGVITPPGIIYVFRKPILNWVAIELSRENYDRSLFDLMSVRNTLQDAMKGR